MALATRCPHCETVFRVAADQLKIRGGIVRCGSCSEIFDGNACLVEPPAPSASAAFDAEIEAIETRATPAGNAEPIYTLDFDTTFDPFGILPKTEEGQAAPADEASAASATPQDASPAALELAPPVASATAEAAQAAAAPAQPADANAAPSEPTPEPAITAIIGDLDLDLNVDDLPAAEATERDEAAKQAAAYVPAPTTAPTPAPEPTPAPTPAPSPAPAPVPNYTAWQSRPAAPAVDLVAPDSAHTQPEPEPAPIEPEATQPDSAEPEPVAAFASALNQARNARIEPTLSDALLAPRINVSVADDDEEVPGFVKASRAAEKSSKSQRILMAVASLVFLAALLAQGILNFRNQLAVNLPQLKPTLVESCKVLGCRVDLPSNIDQLSIDTGELQLLSGGIHSYATVLKNHSAHAQTWPVLELRLRDEKRQTLLRRVLQAADYLPKGSDLSKGFAPRSEQAIVLHFDLGHIQAAGYDVGIFYP